MPECFNQAQQAQHLTVNWIRIFLEEMCFENAHWNVKKSSFPPNHPSLLFTVNIKCLILLMPMLSGPNGSESISSEMLLPWMVLTTLGWWQRLRLSCSRSASTSPALLGAYCPGARRPREQHIPSDHSSPLDQCSDPFVRFPTISW